jgi:L-iditol 2-dehydrogenase
VKALRVYGKQDLRLVDEADPTPGPGEVLLRVTAVGLCGSDRHWYVEGGIGDTVLTDPLVLGHEFAATIVSGPRAGERVAVDPAIPCGRCVPCGRGDGHLCSEVRFAGHGATDGALRSLMAWPERLAYRLPDGLSDVEGALVEPLGVALHALDLASVRPGMRTGVIGCGPIGLLLVQLLLTMGAAVAAVDLLPHRTAAAAEMGAVTAAPEGVDVVFEVTDQDALDAAVAAVRPGGRIVLVGIPSGDRSGFTASAARRKGVTIAVSRRMRPADLPRALTLAEREHVALEPLVTERFALDEGQQAFDTLAERRGLKVIVNPQQGQAETT